MGEAKRRREARAAEAGANVIEQSQPQAPAPSPSGAPQAGNAFGLELLDRFDKWSNSRNRLRNIAQKAGEWAGIPMPIEGEELVVHPSYAFAGIVSPKRQSSEEQLTSDGYRIRNIFWSWRWRCKIAIVEKDGKVDWTPIIGTGNNLTMALSTLGCSFAWGIEQESRALKLLGELVRHVAFKQYLLTGMFLETSKRSGITYLFRKLRPTVAIHERHGKLAIMCALCMHPIAFYASSWAGAMCPTDDLIAHLMMMRGDEARFWRMCNQHPAYHQEAGL